MNILRELCDDLGYTNVTNQYIELSARYYENEHGNESVKDEAKNFNLSISVLPEGYRARIARGYLVGVHSSFEKFLCAFKELPGNPTERVNRYDSRVDKNELHWILKACYGNNRPPEVSEYYYICNYYRLTRNYSVHGRNSSSEYRMARAQVANLNRSLLKSGMSDNLRAPNGIEALNFDDQVLFSRAARALAERIFKDSTYDWNEILEKNRSLLKEMTHTVCDNIPKRNKKIINYLAQTYPAKNQPELVESLQLFVL